MRGLCVPILALLGCAAPRTHSHGRAIAPRPASMVFEETMRVVPKSAKLAPHVSLCEVTGALFVCGTSALPRADDPRQRVEAGLPHEGDALAGDVAQFVGRFPDAAWLRLTTPGPCEETYRFRRDHFERVGMPVCHSQAASVHLVPVGDDVVLATQGYEADVALSRPDGTPVGEGATPACSEGLVTMGAFGLIAAHRDCGGSFVLDLWTSSLGKAREIRLPEGIHVAGSLGDRLYGGTDDGRPWSAQLEGGVVKPRVVDAAAAPIVEWRRAPDGTEWILSGERLLRTRAGTTVAISTPLPAFALWAPRADEVWIAVVRDDHSRALIRGHY